MKKDIYFLILFLSAVMILLISSTIITAENETQINQTDQTNQTNQTLPELGCFNDSNCNDNNSLTLDYCINNSCIHQEVECLGDINCNDSNESTTDTCVNNSCIYELNETGTNESIINQSNESYQNETSQLNQTTELNPDFLIEFMSVVSPSFFFRMFTLGLHGLIAQNNDQSARFLLTAFQPSTRNAESSSYSANIGFFSNTMPYLLPIINSYYISPSSAPKGTIIKFFISASNIQSVWATITRPDGTMDLLPLTNNGKTFYDLTNLTGIYYVTFYANDSRGTQTSLTDSFQIENLPSGGKVSCAYIWDCTSWSICSNEKQTRMCKNIGNCIGEESKPIEERDCSNALFDISIKLKNATLTQDETLKFTVNLIETLDIKKIDVLARYSVRDSNNTEIFNQTETRAVNGNLTYEKEIDGIKFKEGAYTLRVDISYADSQRAFAQQNFNVEGGEIKIEEQKSKFNYNLILIFLLALILFIIILFFILKKRKHHKKFSKEKPKTKKSRKNKK